MELSEILKTQLKKGGFTIESLAKGFCDEIEKKVSAKIFIAVFQNLENETSIALCEVCGCGESGGGFDVLEEFVPMDILDAKTRNMVKLSGFAGFGAKKVNKIIMDGLGSELAAQKAKTGLDIAFVMGKYQCENCSFVIFEIDRQNLEIVNPLGQVSIIDSMQKSKDVQELFA